jgi:hypothetical protein
MSEVNHEDAAPQEETAVAVEADQTFGGNDDQPGQALASAEGSVYPVGSLLSVKIGEFPFWPAVVVDPQPYGVDPIEGCVAVSFLGTGDFSQVVIDPLTVRPFDLNDDIYQEVTDEGLQAALNDAAAAYAAANQTVEVEGDENESASEGEGEAADGAQALSPEELAEKARRKEEKRRKKLEKKLAKKEKKRKEAELAKKAAAESAKRPKERKEDRSRREHRRRGDSNDRTVGVEEAADVADAYAGYKEPITTTNLLSIVRELHLSNEQSDVPAARSALSRLCQYSLSFDQLVESKVGLACAALLQNARMAICSEVVMGLIRYWMSSLPQQRREQLLLRPVQ